MIDGLGSLLPPRSIEDILAERVRLVIGGEVYDLPALVIEDNERWKASLQTELVALLSGLQEAGDDIGGIVASLTGEPDRLISLLKSYDQNDVLPDAATLRTTMTPIGLLRAVLEVWRAANPLVDIGLVGAMMITTTPSPESPEPTSLPRRNGAGRRAKSGRS